MQELLLEDISALNKTVLEFLDRDAERALQAAQQAIEKWNAARPTELPISNVVPLVREHLISLNLMASMMVESQNYADAPALLLKAVHYAEEYSLPVQRAESLRLLGVYHALHGEQSSAELYFSRAALVYGDCNDFIGKAKVIANIGNLALMRGEYEKAIEYYLQVMSALERGSHAGLEIGTRKSLGDAYLDTGDYAHAFEYYMQALALAEERNEMQGNTNILDGIGNLYEVIGDFDTALGYYRRAYALIEENGNVYSLAGILHNIGTLFKHKCDFVMARGYLRQSLEQFRKVHDENGIAHCLVNLASTEIHLGNLNEGYQCAMQGLEAATAVGSKRMIAGGCAALGFVATEALGQGIEAPLRLQEAASYLERGLAIAREGMMHETEMQIHQVMARFYKATGNFEQSLEHTTKSYLLEKEILTRYNTHRLEVVQMQMRIAAQRSENELLRGKNHELGIALENVRRLNRHLEQLNEEKNEFLGIASHDLKNPLSAIRIEAEYILAHLTTLGQDEIRHFMENIRESSLRMFALLEQMLDVNAIEQGSVSSKILPCVVQEIVEETMMRYSEQAKNKNIRVHLESVRNTLALGDATHLRQVVDNLLSNALKFSFPDSDVHIRIERVQNTVAECVRIAIQDQGSGLSDEDKTKLFQKFQKLSARPTAGEHSTGLGLSIVKKLMDMMKGNIRCESEKGKGACFIIELPAA